MDTKPYIFNIEYQNGLRISCHDIINPDTEFWIRVYIKAQNRNKKLIWESNNSGGAIVDEIIMNNESFNIPFLETSIKNHHFTDFFYKGFVSYNIEITKRYTEEIIYSESFDCRYKLVNFTLHSNDIKELHTWMCAIKKFKDETNCEISIINDWIWENKEYDFVDAYYRFKDNFNQYYAGYVIGRFGDENAPDFYRNPDGLKNKTSLDIIEDILYHFTKKL